MKTRDGVEFKLGMTLYTREWSVAKGYSVVPVTPVRADDDGRLFDEHDVNLGPRYALWASPNEVIWSVIKTIESRRDMEFYAHNRDIERWQSRLLD